MKIDWAYLRKGWTSCKKAQEFLENKQVTAAEVIDAGKTKFDEKAAWNMLKDAAAISIAKGKKVQGFDPSKDDKADILKSAMGPSGNLRAPTYRVKDLFVIGFNEELYEDWVK